MRHAACVLVRNHEGKYLVVWNRRAGGFSFPGGRVEGDETPATAALRKLSEETGLYALYNGTYADGLHFVFEGSTDTAIETRGWFVTVFKIRNYMGVACEMEPGCPVTWWTREEFLQWSPFAKFYGPVFEALDASEK